MPSDDAVSLRDVAEWMDPEASARRLYGNGPPFDADRYQAYDPDELSYPMVTVEVDDPVGPAESADPPDSRVVAGDIDAGHLHNKVTYSGVPYLDTIYPTDSELDELDEGSILYVGTKATTEKQMYLVNLFFADLNAYDLGMTNRTPDNDTLPDGYTDKGLVENHRWPEPEDNNTRTEEWRSVRNVVDRHREGVRHRLLWQNLYLPSTRGAFGERRTIAKKFGKRFGAAEYDIVGMCEIPNETLLERVRRGYSNSYADIDTRHAKKDLGVLTGGRRTGENTVDRTISGKEADRYDEAGPAGSGLSKEGWMRASLQVNSLPDNPKFEVFVTHLQPVFGGRKDRKQQVKISQMRELRDEIAERNAENPHRPKIVMGDFNVHSQDGGYGDGVQNAQYFSNFMQQMHSIGMQDVWLTNGGPGPASKDCNLQGDGHSCDPFTPKSGESRESYYRGNRLDYMFVERPRSAHDLRIDINRVKNVTWPSQEHGGYLSDHVGVVVDVLTSPA